MRQSDNSRLYSRRSLRPSKHHVTAEDMRVFAGDCLCWAEHASNASERETILSVARRWLHTAAGIERCLDDGWELVSPDLKKKLD